MKKRDKHSFLDLLVKYTHQLIICRIHYNNALNTGTFMLKLSLYLSEHVTTCNRRM